MKRWMVIVLVMIGLVLGAGIQGFADNGADKVKAANLRAAQDYYKSGLMLAATALGLGVCPVGAFFDEEVESIVGVDQKTEVALYLASVGPLA